MAVSKMKKLALFVCRTQADLLTKKLIRLRCVELRVAEPEADEEYTVKRYAVETRRAEAETRVGQIQAAMDALNPYATRARGLFRGKKRVDPETFLSDGREDRCRDAAPDRTTSRNQRGAGSSSKQCRCGISLSCPRPSPGSRGNQGNRPAAGIFSRRTGYRSDRKGAV